MANFLELNPQQQAAYVAELKAKTEALEKQVKADRARALWRDLGGSVEEWDSGLSKSIARYLEWDESLQPSLNLEEHAPLKAHLHQASEAPAHAPDDLPGQTPAQKLNAMRAASSNRPRAGELERMNLQARLDSAITEKGG